MTTEYWRARLSPRPEDRNWLVPVLLALVCHAAPLALLPRIPPRSAPAIDAAAPVMLMFAPSGAPPSSPTAKVTPQAALQPEINLAEPPPEPLLLEAAPPVLLPAPLKPAPAAHPHSVATARPQAPLPQHNVQRPPAPSETPPEVGSSAPPAASPAPTDVPSPQPSNALDPVWRDQAGAQLLRDWRSTAKLYSLHGIIAVRTRLTISHDGHIKYVRLIQGSGIAAVDSIVMGMLGGEYLPPFPASMPQQEIRVANTLCIKGFLGLFTGTKCPPLPVAN